MGESGFVYPLRPLPPHIPGEHPYAHMKNNISGLDCSQFSDDYDVIRQLPFPVMINPTHYITNQSRATMDGNNIVVKILEIKKTTMVPLSIFCLAYLEELHIEEALFPNNTLPDAITNLGHLRHLFVYNVSIVNGIERLQTLKNLSTLWLDNCSLTYVPNLGGLQQLGYLSLADNRVSHLDELQNVVILNLNDNLFEEIPTIKNKDNVTLIYIGNNPLKNVASITSYTNLRAVSLKNTTLRSIPPNIDKLQNLEAIFLSDNKLSYIPTTILNLPNLEVLDISNNLFSANELESIREKFEKSYPNATLVI